MRALAEPFRGMLCLLINNILLVIHDDHGPDGHPVPLIPWMHSGWAKVSYRRAFTLNSLFVPLTVHAVCLYGAGGPGLRWWKQIARRELFRRLTGGGAWPHWRLRISITGSLQRPGELSPWRWGMCGPVRVVLAWCATCLIKAAIASSALSRIE